MIPSNQELNDRKLSLGVIEVSGECSGFFKQRSEETNPAQGTLFEIADADPSFGATALDIAPYVAFKTSAGKSHTLQIREWGVYEWLRKERAKADQVWENLRLSDGRPNLLVIGNMNNHRNVWLVIKTFKAEAKPMLPFGDDPE